MIECGIVHSGFSQGRLDFSTGEEKEDTWSVRTDFAEIPRGLHTISTTVLVGRKIWNRNEQTYEYAESTTDKTRYVYFYDENKTFIGYKIRTKNNDSTIDFFEYLGARYVRFTVHISDILYPDDTPDPKKSYYYLQNFSTNCQCVEWNLNENNKLIHEDLRISPEKTFTKPYPKALWRIDYLSPNMPYHRLFPLPEPIRVKPVPQREYITIHDMRTEQNNFDNNGLAVLDPISCTVTEAFNAGWTATLEHQIDRDGKWKYIVEFNILKILGQLFVIKKVEHSWTGNSGKVVAYAEHIFYYLNDMWIFKGANIVADSGYRLVKSILDNSRTGWIAGNVIYTFNFYSDITSENLGFDMGQIGYYKWNPLGTAMTPVEMLLGSDGFTENFGGELYRNNFYFSINNRMEYATENAFDIHVGLNLMGIKRTVDTSALCTDFTVFDKFGSGASVYSTKNRGIPHQIVRSKEYTYSDNYTSSNMALLEWEAEKEFDKNHLAKIDITVDLKDVKNNSEYAEFSNNPQYRVGDSGRIYDERLGNYFDAIIIQTVKNGITGENLEVVFSSTSGFTNTSGYDIVIEPLPVTPPDIPDENPDEDDEEEEEENP